MIKTGQASLLIALTSAGAGEAAAAAAVLSYRALSCWALLPIGFGCWIGQQARTPTRG